MNSKIVKWSVFSIVTIALSTGAFLLVRREAMKRGLVKIGKYDIRSEGILQEGDLAPDLELERLDGSGRVRLSELWTGKPLVLMFGSYT